jgi:hypothetical protein
MENFEEYIKMLAGKDRRLLTRKEKDFIKLIKTPYLTVDGRLTIPEMVNMYGEPIIVKEYAKIEVRTGSIAMPFIVVERFVDAKLKFSEKIVVPGIPQGLLLKLPHNGFDIRWVRLDDYRASNMPKATKSEFRKAMAERARKHTEV